MLPPTNPVIDESVLDGYRFLQEEGRTDVVTEFIDVFLEDLDPQLARIRAAVASQNAKEIRSAGHSLKGSAGSIGATRLSLLAGELEILGRQGGSDGADRIGQAIVQEAALVRQALARYRR
jgi:HPt (histidine-containing phosphotransfer) domain-containing protein